MLMDGVESTTSSGSPASANWQQHPTASPLIPKRTFSEHASQGNDGHRLDELWRQHLQGLLDRHDAVGGTTEALLSALHASPPHLRASIEMLLYSHTEISSEELRTRICQLLANTADAPHGKEACPQASQGSHQSTGPSGWMLSHKMSTKSVHTRALRQTQLFPGLITATSGSAAGISRKSGVVLSTQQLGPITRSRSSGGIIKTMLSQSTRACHKRFLSAARTLTSGKKKLRRSAAIEARKVLRAAQSEGRVVHDDEVLRVLRLWAFDENYQRRNVIPAGRKWVKSDTLGLLCVRGRWCKTTATKEHPDFTKLLCRWLWDHRPDEFNSHGFPFTSISVNSGYAARLHRDARNAGPSMIRAFGNFDGGRLRYWPRDLYTLETVSGQAPAPGFEFFDDTQASQGKNIKRKKRLHQLSSLQSVDKVVLDVRRSLVFFDGTRGHEVEPFTGERYSIVFFTTSKYQQAPQVLKDELRELGIMFPTRQAMRYARGCLKGLTSYLQWQATPSTLQTPAPSLPPQPQPDHVQLSANSLDQVSTQLDASSHLAAATPPMVSQQRCTVDSPVEERLAQMGFTPAQIEDAAARLDFQGEGWQKPDVEMFLGSLLDGSPPGSRAAETDVEDGEFSDDGHAENEDSAAHTDHAILLALHDSQVGSIQVENAVCNILGQALENGPENSTPIGHGSAYDPPLTQQAGQDDILAQLQEERAERVRAQLALKDEVCARQAAEKAKDQEAHLRSLAEQALNHESQKRRQAEMELQRFRTALRLQVAAIRSELQQLLTQDALLVRHVQTDGPNGRWPT